MQLKDISQAVQAVQDLINSGCTKIAPVDPFEAIKMNDIYPMCRMLFTKKSAQILHNRTNNFVHQRNLEHTHLKLTKLLAILKIKQAQIAVDYGGTIGYTRVCDIVTFFGSSAGFNDVGLAIDKIAKTINYLADKEYITAALAPLSIIEFVNLNGTDKQFIIVSYIAVTQDGVKYVEQNLKDMIFVEGGMPNSVKDQKGV